MRKIELSDLVDTKEQKDTNPIFLYNKHELQENKNVTTEKDNFFNLKPITPLEKGIYSILHSEKNLAREKTRKNIILAQFDSKMRRIKNIKSKTYRRIKRQEKIVEMIADSEEKKLQDTVPKQLYNPSELLEKHEKENNDNNVYDFGMEDKIEKQKIQVDIVKSIFGEEKDEFIDKFKQQKENVMEEDVPEQIKEILPGWGAWGGTELEIVESKYNTFVKFKDGVECEDRLDYKHDHVIINESAAKMDDKYIATIPYGYTVKDYEIKMETPVIKAWVDRKTFKKNNRAIKNNKIINHDTE